LQGFSRVQNLEEYTGLKVLWLEGNGLARIEGLDAQAELTTLYLQENMIDRIEGLGHLANLNTVNLSKVRACARCIPSCMWLACCVCMVCFGSRAGGGLGLACGGGGRLPAQWVSVDRFGAGTQLTPGLYPPTPHPWHKEATIWAVIVLLYTAVVWAPPCAWRCARLRQGHAMVGAAWPLSCPVCAIPLPLPCRPAAVPVPPQNCISKVENLGTCGSLQTLLLGDNRIRSDGVEGLLEIPTLTCLDLQNNTIEDPAVRGTARRPLPPPCPPPALRGERRARTPCTVVWDHVRANAGLGSSGRSARVRVGC
jgi:hypothetical protein